MEILRRTKQANLPCAWQSWTVKSADPALAAVAQALCCTEQLLCRAAPLPTKVSPLTVKGRVTSVAEETTGGAVPPREPVNVCTLVPEAAARFRAIADTELLEKEEEDEAACVVVPTTAAWISDTVASGTRRFWLMIQPTLSLVSSHVFPLAVGSPIYLMS